MRHPNILDESGAALLVIDLQDSLLKAIHEHERVVANSVKLIETAKIFSIPILVTLQYA
ncbi:isochorismatase family protein, partial [bacterium]|nr:isochorismatase family protein [bacterium]